MSFTSAEGIPTSPNKEKPTDVEALTSRPADILCDGFQAIETGTVGNNVEPSWIAGLDIDM